MALDFTPINFFLLQGQTRNLAAVDQRVPTTDRRPGQRVPEGGNAKVDQHEVHLQGQGHPPPTHPCRAVRHQ